MNTNYISETMIYGKCFIVPNAGTVNNRHMAKTWNAAMEQQFGESEIFVNIWCCTPGDPNSNWGCHQDYPGASADSRFPTYFPAKIFAGKKEGDTIVLQFGSKTVELELAQHQFRYRSFGSFEDVLEDVVRRAE